MLPDASAAIVRLMRLVLLTLATLVAFAANSIFNRAALAEQQMDPAVFTAIRLAAGALVLGGLTAIRGSGLRETMRQGSAASAGALLLYAVFFSFAYVTLDAGLGALILFGGVQLTMFAGALLSGQRPGLWRWLGSGLGLVGLAILFLPGAQVPGLGGVLLMLVAAFGWGIYSLRGQRTTSPLQATAANFILAAPFGIAALAITGIPAPSTAGVALAIASGALASGLGYAMWYSVLPQLEASVAAIAQLTVPLIALVGGILFLGEVATPTFLIASVLILGGVALALYGPRLWPR